MKFVTKLSTDHATAAKLMADSGMDAGQRLTVAMQRLQLHLGRIMQPIGAFFQKTMAIIINSINGAIEALGRFFNIGTQNQRKNLAAEVTSASQEYTLAIRQGLDKSTDRRDIARFNRIKNRRDTAFANQKAFFDENPSAATASKFDDPVSDDQKLVNLAKIKQELGLIGEQEVKNLEINVRAKEIYKEIGGEANEFGLTVESITEKLKNNTKETFNLKEEFKKLINETTDFKTKIGELALDVTDKLGNAFADFFIEGKRGFADLARSAIKELQRIIIKAMFMKFIANPILGALGLNADGNVIEGGDVVPSAKGNVFAKNKIVPYKMGGIVSRPTIFPMRNGAGLMGEAGPEGILPLKRGKDGKLGVISQGGGIGNIVVNVDASGSSVEGDENEGRELGRLIAVAVQSELLQQKRPGGLLA